MADIEKVNTGLKCLADVHDGNCAGCGYSEIAIYPVCVRQVSKDALSVIEEQQAEIERLQPRWIPVSERLPEDGERVLVMTKSGNQFVGFHTQFSGWHFEYVIHPTHWMPLPKPPMMD